MSDIYPHFIDEKTRAHGVRITSKITWQDGQVKIKTSVTSTRPQTPSEADVTHFNCYKSWYFISYWLWEIEQSSLLQ